MAAVTEALPAYRQLEQMKLRCQAAVAASLANEPIATQRRYDADVRSSVRNGLMEKSNRGDRNKPSLERIFARQGERGIVRAYEEHGYRIREIAAHLGVHYSTVSRRLNEMEQEE